MMENLEYDQVEDLKDIKNIYTKTKQALVYEFINIIKIQINYIKTLTIQ